MKKSIYLNIIILAIIVVSLVYCVKQEATTTGDCSDYILETEDEVTGEKSILSKSLVISEDGGKTGFKIFGMVNKYKKMDFVGIFIKVSGAGSYIEEGAKINFLFRDGSRLELRNASDSNYESTAMLAFSKKLTVTKHVYIKEQIEQLMTKEVKTMRVWTNDGYVQEDFTKQNSIDFMMSLKCLNEYIE